MNNSDVLEVISHDDYSNSGEQTPLLSHRRLVRGLSGIQENNSTAVNIEEARNGNVSQEYWTHLRDFIHYDEPVQIQTEENQPLKTERTLGAIAGVFSPVSLSMFSALLFLRVGKSAKPLSCFSCSKCHPLFLK